jgi:beta-ureidopropionase / N-carbamoyl-L-amino-acid hydrolase
MKIKPNSRRIQRDIESLSKFTDPEEKGYTRLSFTSEYQQATDHVIDLMKSEAGLVVRQDAIGNVVGFREGRKKAAPSLMVGSHLDTVRQGGRFDGTIGVLAGLEIARCLEEADFRLQHPFEVVSFLAEEPSPFGMSTVGSRGMTGHLTVKALKKAENGEGKSLFQAIKEIGGNPDQLESVKRVPQTLAAFLELHVEQGPVLEQEKIPVGVVNGIVTIIRGEIEVLGESNHAGTTPMTHRKDALTAAAEVVTVINRICRSFKNMVGTVGEFVSYPNASNVIPGKVKMGLEVRSPILSHIEAAIAEIEESINQITRVHELDINSRFWLSSPGVSFSESMLEIAVQSCDELNIPYLEMTSGAGHDASYLAEITPAAMIFVPSRKGLSHCPGEFSELQDIVRGIEVIAAMILKLDAI